MAPYILYSVLCWLSTSIMYGLMIEFHTSPLEATLCYLGFIIHLYSSYTLNRVHMILQVKHICTALHDIFMLKLNCIIFIVVEKSEVFIISRICFWLYQEINFFVGKSMGFKFNQKHFIFCQWREFYLSDLNCGLLLMKRGGTFFMKHLFTNTRIYHKNLR